MPVKKTTKKAPAKKTTKAPVKKSLAKATPSVTMSASKEVCAPSCCSSTTVRTILLLVANTVLLLFLVSNFWIKKALNDMEIKRVGGVENYELIQKIYELDTFKQQQQFQIEQTYQALQAAGQQPEGAMMPTEEPQQ